MISPSSILKKYWGYDEFRPLQEDIIESVLAGRDTLALLPTGGGKSICFQVPALIKEGLCLVISPLIALMQDQVDNLLARNIPAAVIHSGLSYFEVKKILQSGTQGDYRFLYLSPERLETKLFKEYLPALSVDLVVVDEAHCISQWGYDFRPPYLRIAALREELPDTTLIALTASATPAVQEDIMQKLLFRQPNIFRQSFERPNISYSVFSVDSKINKLIDILNKVPGSSIVYCGSRKQTKELAQLLGLHSIAADFYHAGLPQELRNSKQQSWIANKTRVIVCTNAFGMGIDKPDVRTVIHFDAPDCLENYYQEAGRAGRDGKKSFAVLLYQHADKEALENLPARRFPPIAEIKKIYQSLADYLQVPVGSGEGQYYDFDLLNFVR
ncbi:MAG: ATP-dependent DNA helicase RecQ, partial [Chitinophagaceae bacterium]|nr:ATP-dependent DNA helicase RecQ [Chitinophagaceae bacterium]